MSNNMLLAVIWLLISITLFYVKSHCTTVDNYVSLPPFLCSAETSRKSGALIYPEPLGPPRPVAGDLYFYLPSYIYIYICVCVCVF